VPTLKWPFTNGQPLVPALLRCSRYREEALKIAGQPVPEWANTLLLVDTGASNTCIDPYFLQALDIPSSGSVDMHTPSTGNNVHSCYLYDVQLSIRNTDSAFPPLHISLLPVMGTSLLNQGIGGLLGRDVLQDCLLVMNPAHFGYFTLSY